MSQFSQKHPLTVGQPVDLAPFGYLWRKGRPVQDKPEAEFLPRRIARQDAVYRTALTTLGPEAVKSPHYQQKDLLKPQLPPAKGEMLTGLLWVGGITDYAVTLVWPEEGWIPSPDQVEVRVYPTAWGWFGFSTDRHALLGLAMTAAFSTTRSFGQLHNADKTDSLPPSFCFAKIHLPRQRKAFLRLVSGYYGFFASLRMTTGFCFRESGG